MRRVYGQSHVPSDKDKEIRRLKDHVHQLESRLPDLKLGFWEQRALCESVELRVDRPNYVWFSDEDIAKRIEDERGACLSAIPSDYERIIPDRVREYQSSVHSYLKEFEAHLKRLREVAAGWRVAMLFALKNVGSVAATGVEAEIDMSEAVTESVEFDEKYMSVLKGLQPRRPSSPKRPTSGEILLGNP